MNFYQWLKGVQAVLMERGWHINELERSIESLPYIWFNLFHSCKRHLRFAADSIEVYYAYKDLDERN